MPCANFAAKAGTVSVACTRLKRHALESMFMLSLPFAGGAQNLLLGGFEAEKSLFGFGWDVTTRLHFFQTEQRRYFGEKTLGEALGGLEGVFLLQGGVLHHAQKDRPSEQGAAMQPRRSRIEDRRAVTAGDDMAFVIQAASSGTAIHLQQLIRREFVLAAAIVKVVPAT
jgi:hypothetical protein